MKKIVNTAAIMLVVAVAGNAAAQSPVLHIPEETDILPKILSADSPFYYPAMMARYMEGDTELTDEHYFYLYYGYAYNDDYDAHKDLPGESVIAEILSRTQNPTRAEALSIVEAARQNMMIDPFSPGNINLMTWVYGIAGDTINEAVSADRFRKIIRTIESSGTGLREKSPWHILRFSHATDLVASKGLRIVNNQVRSRTVEYIQVDRNPERIKGYFFNYERVYWNPYEGERANKKSKWTFNGIPL